MYSKKSSIEEEKEEFTLEKLSIWTDVAIIDLQVFDIYTACRLGYRETVEKIIHR